jgi:VWFA-related protein
MNVSGKLLTATSLGILLALISSAAAAQSKTSSKTIAKPNDKDLVLRVQVRRVPVDVVVLDKQGNPILGLKKNDFVVKEDSRPQHVLTFDWFDGSAPSFVPPKAPAMPVNTFINLPTVPERGPLYVLYYDMVNTPIGDQMAFRQELLRFIDDAPPGTRIALFVNARGLHLVQGFTTDHALLRDAVLRNGSEAYFPKVFIYAENYGHWDVGAALSSLNFIAEYLGGIPERKNLIWLSSAFPIPVGPKLISVGGDPPQVYDLTELTRDLVKHTYAALMRSQIALYPVSLTGVAGGGDAMLDHDDMERIASSTGGRASYSDNRERFQIEKAFEHGRSYYTLTYSPDNAKYDGSERKIQVALAKKCDCTLTYRNVYYAVSDDEVQLIHKKEVPQARFLAAKAADTLYASIEHGAPLMHDLLFSAHLAAVGELHMATVEQMQQLEDAPAYFHTRRRSHSQKPLTPVKLQKYVIDYGVIDPHLRALAAKKPSVLEFAAAAYDNDGRLMNSMLNEGALSGERPIQAKSQALFHAVQELEVPAGAEFIRLAVRNTLNNRTGTLEVKLPLKVETETAQSATSGTPSH